ncbi:DUF3429 domain-containing protein [Phenylobacterium aquaticum]|uniref:DUF3429 domain-containing protein n=1 Tax=Phenylobacterium aquaticum TaxID=1763816 RepID=UPI001F5E2A36|nr:DUF3429 domain-containing protein [Phenylobacterium aquaticum]MCI3134312.1 DUF3429 domain-containing protein [Phenylobacterium aquaticum]
MPSPAPRIAWIYGLAGLIPFAAAAGVAALSRGMMADYALMTLLVYGALILSFLGGARWGMEVVRPQVRIAVISLSMAPTLAGFALLIAPHADRGVQCALMAAAFVAQWVWDTRGFVHPAWYPRLRTVLTLGAVAALGVGSFVA